eukprot:m.103585 g.103585  ORF g.103585 m.103585 type:complete len:77 (-) comp9065_c1_seq1:141-371(-)
MRYAKAAPALPISRGWPQQGESIRHKKICVDAGTSGFLLGDTAAVVFPCHPAILESSAATSPSVPSLQCSDSRVEL